MKPRSQREIAQDTLSREVGYVLKPHANRLRVALVFPNTYFVGMSNLGFQTIYRLFNDEPGIVCGRVFLPPKQGLAGVVSHPGAGGCVGGGEGGGGGGGARARPGGRVRGLVARRATAAPRA